MVSLCRKAGLVLAVAISACAKPVDPEAPSNAPSGNVLHSKIVLEPSEVRLAPALRSELQGTRVERMRKGNFRLTNRANAVEVVTFLGSSCNCIGVIAKGRPLGRGDVVRLQPLETVNVELQAFLSPRAQEYSFEAVFATQTRPGNHAHQRVRLRASVIDDVGFSPGVLRYDVSAARETTDKTITLRRVVRSAKPDWRDPRVEGLPRGVQVVGLDCLSASKLAGSGLWSKEWQLTFRIGPTENVSRSLDPIEIVFEQGARPGEAVLKARVPVAIGNKGAITAADSLHFGIVPLGGKRQRRLLVNSTEGQFSILDVRPSATDLCCEWLSGCAQSRHWIDVCFSGRTSGAHRSQVVIRTDRPKNERIEVGIAAVVSSPAGEETNERVER